MNTSNDISDNSPQTSEPSVESTPSGRPSVPSARPAVRRVRSLPKSTRKLRKSPNVVRNIRHRALDQIVSRQTAAQNSSEPTDNTAAEDMTNSIEGSAEEMNGLVNNETRDENQNQTENSVPNDIITSNETNLCIDLTEDDTVVNENNTESDAEIQCITTIVEDPDVCIVRDTKRLRNRLRRPERPERPERPRSPIRNDEIIEISDFRTNHSQPIASPALTTSPTKNSVNNSLKKSIKCPVCLDEYSMFNVSGKQLVSTNCGHLFCDRCIKEVIKTTKSCPNCRKKIATQKSYHPIYL